MTLEELIRLLENKLADAINKNVLAISIGDIEQNINLTSEIETTAATLQKLKSLSS
jgi:hypothetical protein